jgi:hypothetical protein
MTDEGASFLARWSKRKVEARDGAAPRELQEESASQAAKPQDEAEQEVPLEDLPAIESIDASTDLTPWLRRKVPESWRRAALSRAWTADPAISQFTGLADYAWDWNAPDGVPGFGPLRAADDVVQLLAQAIGQAPQPDTHESEETALVAEPAEFTTSDLPEPEMLTKEADAPLLDESIKSEPKSLSSQADPETQQPRLPRKRRGGGALPS